MDTQDVIFHQTLHQGELEQFCNELLKYKGISNRLLQRRRPIGCATPEQFLWNAIRCQKGAEVKEFGCRRIGLLNLLNREQPGSGDRVGVVGREHSTLGEQGLAMGLVEVEIVHKAALCFFNIGSCLIEGKRKMIERDDNISCLIDLFISSMPKALRSTKQKLCAFEKAHCFHFDGGSQRTNGIGAGGQQNAAVAEFRKVVAHQSDLISVIKDQQPTLLTLLQPAFDRFHQLALVRLNFHWKGRKQFCKCDKTGEQRLFTRRIDPEGMGVPITIMRTIGIFNGNLRLANPAESLNSLRLCQRCPTGGRRMLLCFWKKLFIKSVEQFVAPGKMRIASIGHIPDP